MVRRAVSTQDVIYGCKCFPGRCCRTVVDVVAAVAVAGTVFVSSCPFSWAPGSALAASHPSSSVSSSSGVLADGAAGARTSGASAASVSSPSSVSSSDAAFAGKSKVGKGED